MTIYAPATTITHNMVICMLVQSTWNTQQIGFKYDKLDKLKESDYSGCNIYSSSK